MELIKIKKQTNSFTNMELNVYNALQDIGTQTEWFVMAIYHENISIPYAEMVRGSGNGLCLGEYHTHVIEHLGKAVDNPDHYLDDDPEAYVFASLDGKPWRNPEVMKAAFERLPDLPHAKVMLQKFFAGAQSTMLRFTSEFAPGGAIIDGTTADEKALAFMLGSNCPNEGILGAWCVFMRQNPVSTVHGWNGLEMFSRNVTQEFVDRLCEETDDVYIMREARFLDRSGLEKKRKQEQLDFDLRLAKMKLEKEKEKSRIAGELVARLQAVHIITRFDQIRAPGMTNIKLQESALYYL